MSQFFDYMELCFVLCGASLWCWGFHIIAKTFWNHVFDDDIDQNWKNYSPLVRTLIKPLFACPYCMGSVHGTAIFFIALFGSFGLWYWPAFCVCLCGLNYIIKSQLFPEYE